MLVKCKAQKTVRVAGWDPPDSAFLTHLQHSSSCCGIRQAPCSLWMCQVMLGTVTKKLFLAFKFRAAPAYSLTEAKPWQILRDQEHTWWSTEVKHRETWLDAQKTLCSCHRVTWATCFLRHKQQTLRNTGECDGLQTVLGKLRAHLW